MRIPPPPQPPLRAGALLGTFSSRRPGGGEAWRGYPPRRALQPPLLRRPDGPPEPVPGGKGPRSGGGARKPRRGGNGRTHGTRIPSPSDWLSGGSGGGCLPALDSRAYCAGGHAPAVVRGDTALRAEVRDWLGGGGGLAAVAW